MDKTFSIINKAVKGKCIFKGLNCLNVLPFLREKAKENDNQLSNQETVEEKN